MSVFYGKLRLKKDPKVEELNTNNFIPRGCKIQMNKDKDWIFGLVVYSGMDTKIMQDKSYKIKKISHLERLIGNYIFASICLVFFLAIISMIVIVAKSKNYGFLLIVEPSIVDSIRLFTYIILYSQMIPLSVYFILDAATIGSCKMIEKRMKQQSNQKNDYFEIKNPDALCNLGEVNSNNFIYLSLIL